MGCCYAIPYIPVLWLWEWGNPSSMAASSAGSTVGSMSSSDQRCSEYMWVHVPNSCYAAPPLSPSPIHSLCISVERFCHCSVIQQIVYMSNHLPDCLVVAKGVLEPLLLVFDCLEWLLWFRVLDCSSVPFHSIPFHSAPFCKLVPIHCWQCTSPHHDDDHEQFAHQTVQYTTPLYISVICVGWGCVLNIKWSEWKY